MSLPDRNAPWPTIVTYFTEHKKDGESLGVVLKRASLYRKTGKVSDAGASPSKTSSKTSSKTVKKMGKAKKGMRGMRSKSVRKH
jgi:hypothetical protein